MSEVMNVGVMNVGVMNVGQSIDPRMNYRMVALHAQVTVGSKHQTSLRQNP